MLNRNLFALLLVSSAAAHAATLTYAGPDAGMPAPCNAKLEDCLTGSASGDTIEIATNTPISENLYIQHSLTLKSKAGFTGTIAPPGANYVDLTLDDTSGAQTVTLDGLDMSKVNVTLAYQHFPGSSVTFTNDTVGCGLNANASQPYTLVARHNKLVDVGAGEILDLRQSTSADGTSITLDANELYSPSGAVSNEEALEFIHTGTGAFTLNVTNNVFHDFSGCGCGTPVAIQLSLFSSGAASQVNILNNTFDGSGNGGIYVTAPGSGNVALQIYNNAFTNFTHYAYYFPATSPHLSISYGFNHLFGATEVLGGYTVGGGLSDTGGDPLYVNRAAHDYRLAATSPLINSGYSGVGAEPSTDFTGNPRITEGVVDRGAYERNADLSVSASGNPTAPAVGADVTYTVTLTNNGPYDVGDASDTLVLPAGMLFKSASVPNGTCAGTSTVTCTAGAVSAGSAINATVIATATTKGDQTVALSVAGGPSDPNTSNNTASIVTHTGQVADAGTADGGTGGDGAKTGCGCASSSADLSAFGLLLALMVLGRRAGRAARE